MSTETSGMLWVPNRGPIMAGPLEGLELVGAWHWSGGRWCGAGEESAMMHGDKTTDSEPMATAMVPLSLAESLGPSFVAQLQTEPRNRAALETPNGWAEIYVPSPDGETFWAPRGEAVTRWAHGVRMALVFKLSPTVAVAKEVN